MPGEDPAEAARVALDACPDLPFLPELPARGPGADMLGRTASLLPGLHIDLQPAGWRFVDRPGRDERRGQSYLSYDLDAFEQAAQGYAGPLKVQLAGPWTLAASVELTRGNRALTDPGAVRDVTESLAEAVRLHVADLRRRVPGAVVLVQVDEPSLPAVLAGQLRTASGFATVAAVEVPTVEEHLRTVLGAVAAAGGVPLVHCCATRAPIGLLVRAGTRAVSVDLGLVADDEALGDCLEAGVGLFAGVAASVPAATVTAGGPDRAAKEAATVVRSRWSRLGLPADRLASSVVVTPTCGLAGATPAHARMALAACREAARRLGEDPAGQERDA
jgi:hypothetical protein